MDLNIYILSGAIFVYSMFIIGAIGSFLPIIPGPFIAAVGLAAFKLMFPESAVSWLLVGVSVALAVAAQGVDFFATWLGAKKFGATWRGILGAFVGVFAGIFIPPPVIWVFIAPLIFAFAFEWLGGAGVRAAANAGIGAFVGTILASVVKFLMVVFLAMWFTFAVFF